MCERERVWRGDKGDEVLVTVIQRHNLNSSEEHKVRVQLHCHTRHSVVGREEAGKDTELHYKE